MKRILMDQPVIPTKITTGSYQQIITTFNANKDKELGLNLIGTLKQTHCPEISDATMVSTIDFLKVVFPVDSIEKSSSLKALLSIWLHKVGIANSNQKPSLRHHKNGVKLFPLDECNNCCGSFKWDETKLQLELTGAGCDYIKTSPDLFLPLYALLKQYHGKITEVDIAIDDLSGKYNLNYVSKAYSEGLYTPKTGQKPIKNADKKHLGSIYIGRNDAPKSVCIYEKCREQKLPEGHELFGKWIRHELTLRRRNRHELPLDILTDHDSYFVGAYPKMHRRLIKNVKPLSTKRKKFIELAQSLSKSAAHLKYQYGRVINAISEVFDDDKKAIKALRRESKTKNFLQPSYLDLKTIKENLTDEGGDICEHMNALIEANNPLSKRATS